jgi:hypothetical protein
MAAEHSIETAALIRDAEAPGAASQLKHVLINTLKGLSQSTTGLPVVHSIGNSIHSAISAYETISQTSKDVLVAFELLTISVELLE